MFRRVRKFFVQFSCGTLRSRKKSDDSDNSRSPLNRSAINSAKTDSQKTNEVQCESDKSVINSSSQNQELNESLKQEISNREQSPDQTQIGNPSSLDESQTEQKVPIDEQTFDAQVNELTIQAEQVQTINDLDTIINKHRALRERLKTNFNSTITAFTNSSGVPDYGQPRFGESYDEYQDLTKINDPGYIPDLDNYFKITSNDSAKDILTPLIHRTKVVLLKNSSKFAGGFGMIRESKLYLISVKENNYRVDKKYVCLKRPVNRNCLDTAYVTLNEIKIHKECKHENILEYIGVVFIKPTKFYIVTEYCDGMDAHDFLYHKRFNNNTCTKWQMTHSIEIVNILEGTAKGIEYLHGKSIIHRDIKSPNILLFPTRRTRAPGTTQYIPEFIAKIADFGLALSYRYSFYEFLQSPENIGGVLGTTEWLAPEVQNFTTVPNSLVYTKATDIFSFGILMAELLIGGGPYNHLNEGQKRLLSQRRKLYFNDLYVREDFSNVLVNLMWSCTHFSPARRRKINEILT
ncbi:unnamed protein product, partial [Brachionus calyciflorus]